MIKINLGCHSRIVKANESYANADKSGLHQPESGGSRTISEFDTNLKIHDKANAFIAQNDKTE